MIQIQSREQFKRASERAAREHMRVRRYEPGVYEITNTAKGHSYLVRFTFSAGRVFGQCTCEAGTPTHGRSRVPMVCKHLFAAVIMHRALVRMRRAITLATNVEAAYFADEDDADCDPRNY